MKKLFDFLKSYNGSRVVNIYFELNNNSYCVENCVFNITHLPCYSYLQNFYVNDFDDCYDYIDVWLIK